MDASGLVARAEVASFGYHEVTDDPSSSGFQRPSATVYKHTQREFARHLDAFGAADTAPTLVTDVAFGEPGRHVLLTFDDGGISALDCAEMLSDRGWRGHYFIVTSLIGTRGFLSHEALCQLHAAGHLVGSHSHTHSVPFRSLSPERQLEEWRESCDRLAQIVGAPCVVASVPGGEVSPTTFEIAAEVGLSCLFTSDPVPTPQRVGGCWILGRFMPKISTPATRVGELAQFRGWQRAAAARRFRMALKRLFPTPHLLYRWARSRQGRSAGERPASRSCREA